MPIISVETMKKLDERASVIQGVLYWAEVISKCN